MDRRTDLLCLWFPAHHDWCRSLSPCRFLSPSIHPLQWNTRAIQVVKLIAYIIVGSAFESLNAPRLLSVADSGFTGAVYILPCKWSRKSLPVVNAGVKPLRIYCICNEASSQHLEPGRAGHILVSKFVMSCGRLWVCTLKIGHTNTWQHITSQANNLK